MRTAIRTALLALVTVMATQAAFAWHRHQQPLKSSSPGSLAAVGPFELVSPDSTSRLRLQFTGQLRLGFESKDRGTSKSRTQETYMEARRVRLTLSGSVFASDLTYRVHLSTAPHSLELMDFYFNYRLKRGMEIRYGQYKVPFTRYRIQSFSSLTFADWAIVTKYFGAERQMGFAVHNGYEKPPRWAYAGGVFTGVNARASHGIGVPLVYGESIANPSDLANPGPRAKFHPELFIHVAYNANGIQVQSDSDEEGGGLRYSAGLSVGWDLNPTDYQDFSGRLAGELLMKCHGASLFAVGYLGLVDQYSDAYWRLFGSGSNRVSKLAMVGGLCQTSYRLNRRVEVSARYAIVDFRDALLNDARARAGELFAGAKTKSDSAKYMEIGQVQQEQEATVGCNVYLIGHSLKWQNDAGALWHCRRTETRIDYQVRSQFQVAF